MITTPNASIAVSHLSSKISLKALLRNLQQSINSTTWDTVDIRCPVGHRKTRDSVSFTYFSSPWISSRTASPHPALEFQLSNGSLRNDTTFRVPERFVTGITEPAHSNGSCDNFLLVARCTASMRSGHRRVSRKDHDSPITDDNESAAMLTTHFLFTLCGNL